MPVLSLQLPTGIPLQSSKSLLASAFSGYSFSADQKFNCRAYADSKTLTEDKRENLFEAIQQDPQISFLFDVLSAADISMNMLSRQIVQSVLVQSSQERHSYEYCYSSLL